MTAIKQICNCCKEEFLSDNRDEALAELEKNKPYLETTAPEGEDANDLVIVCDDCYRAIKRKHPGLV